MGEPYLEQTLLEVVWEIEHRYLRAECYSKVQAEDRLVFLAMLQRQSVMLREAKTDTDFALAEELDIAVDQYRRDNLIDNLLKKLREMALRNMPRTCSLTFRHADTLRTIKGAVGITGERDPNSTCEYYRPGAPGNGDCFGDGHYLCQECEEFSPEEEDPPVHQTKNVLPEAGGPASWDCEELEKIEAKLEAEDDQVPPRKLTILLGDRPDPKVCCTSSSCGKEFPLRLVRGMSFLCPKCRAEREE